MGRISTDDGQLLWNLNYPPMQAPPNGVRTYSHCSDDMNRSHCSLFALFVQTARLVWSSHCELFAVRSHRTVRIVRTVRTIWLVRTVRNSHCSHRTTSERRTRLFSVRWTLLRWTLPSIPHKQTSASRNHFSTILNFYLRNLDLNQKVKWKSIFK